MIQTGQIRILTRSFQIELEVELLSLLVANIVIGVPGTLCLGLQSCGSISIAEVWIEAGVGQPASWPLVPVFALSIANSASPVQHDFMLLPSRRLS